MDILAVDAERRFAEIKNDHAKRHGMDKCTPDNCHTKWMIDWIEEYRHRVKNALFLLETSRF